MYCNNCGKQISDDSKFCNFCGTKVKHEENVKDIKEVLKNDNSIKDNIPDEDNTGCFKSFILTIFVIVIVGLLFFAVIKVVSNSDSSGNIVDKVVERDIRKSDYDVSTSQGLTSYTITITPKVKMNECSVFVKLLDSKGNVIYSNTITKKDLMKDYSYSYTFEFGFVSSLSADSISYTVTGKCIG